MTSNRLDRNALALAATAFGLIAVGVMTCAAPHGARAGGSRSVVRTPCYFGASSNAVRYAALFCHGNAKASPARNVHATREGPFSGSYSGRWIRIGMRVEFNGLGKASFLHASKESGSLSEACAVTCYWAGRLQISSTKHPADSLVVYFEESGSQPCFHGEWNVSSGTGKFQNATGRGTLSFTCSSGYSDTWSGQLSF
jgi:hypothetical protein